METKRFQRTVEDFVCEHCSATVKGSGYTNHCPNCLWSKHVDVNPGDRLSDCRGMLEPVDVDIKGGSYTIIHRCQKCAAVKRNKSAPDDDFRAILALATKTS